MSPKQEGSSRRIIELLESENQELKLKMKEQMKVVQGFEKVSNLVALRLAELVHSAVNEGRYVSGNKI